MTAARGVPSVQRLAALLLVPATVALAAFFALAWIPAVFTPDGVLPSGHDAVYHARRILDAVDAPFSVVQFDTRIHAPEGSWVPWPWGFDAFMAALALGWRALTGTAPLTTLMLLPPAFVIVNAALVIAIARALALPPAAQWLAGLCFALSPLTQNLHGAGMIDHHFLEHTCVLVALWAGLRWLARPAATGRAALLGGILGAASAVHNGLFLLQLPLLATLALQWLRGAPLEPRAAAALAVALGTAGLAVALPADALRAGLNAYDLLSWFHVHVAALSALAILLMARLRPDRAGLLLAAGLLALGALPLAGQVLAGIGFVTADMYVDFQMPEMRAPLGDWTGAGLAGSWRAYGGLLFLLPVLLAGTVVAALRSDDARLVYLCACALLGGLLLLLQYRFHQYGSFALYLLPLVWLARRFEGAAQRRALLGFAVLCGLAYGPALPAMVTTTPPPGGSTDFALTRGLFGPLARACAERPGIVLAESSDGHYVHFFSACSVVANNLVITAPSLAKLAEAERLLALPAAQLEHAAPWVRYVLVRRNDDVFEPATAGEIARRNPGLRGELLLQGPPWPAGYALLGEVRLEEAPAPVLARLFERVPADAARGSTP